jgi:hypothetical protein
MNTLQEIGAFVGMSPASMRSVGTLTPLLSTIERTSMQAMILALQNLPPISLDAETVGDRFGDVPFAPSFRVLSSAGAVLETRITLFANGHQKEVSVKVGDSGVFNPITLSIPGVYLMTVTRTGIQSTGITTLERSFHVEGVQAPSQPAPEADPPAPVIDVSSKGDGTFVVGGKGFLPNSSAFIIVGDGTLSTPPITLIAHANASGEFAGFPTGKICTCLATRVFTGNDGRLRVNHTLLVSEPVTLTCPA